MSKIFISHSSRNKEFIKKLKELLSESKYLVWVSFDDIKPGENSAESIKENLKNCDVILFILTREAQRSPYVNQEIGVALALGKNIIPIIEDFNRLPGFLKGIQAIKLFSGDVEKTFSQIVPYLPNRDIYRAPAFKESLQEKKLNLTKTGFDMWIEILKNMNKGATPISSFAGSYNSFKNRNSSSRNMIDRRLEIFYDFFIKSKLVEAVELTREEGLRHYSYTDLKKWEEHWERPVLYKLSNKGKKLLNQWEKKEVKLGDKVALTVETENEK